MDEFDRVAEHYDETRGGERRGDEYAADIDAHLPAEDGPILEIGVGTGVVALGLRRRGRDVLGVDVSAAMLVRARQRLGPCLIRGDALALPVGTNSVAHAASVWVVHAVSDPVRLFEEASRVIRPGGLFVVCATQQPAPDDPVGAIIAAMVARVDARRGAPRPRSVTLDEVLDWAGSAGWTGAVHVIERHWQSSPGQERAAIEQRAWPTMHELEEAVIEEVTRPALEALAALPPDDTGRRATAQLVVFRRG